MKICLIGPSHEESLDPILDPPLGLLYIASILKKDGYDVSVIDLSFYNRESWKSVIPWADIYAITILTASFHRSIVIKEICKKKNPNSIMIAGGPHPTALPEETSKNFDIIVVGEAERIIKEVIDYKGKYPIIFYGNKSLMDINDIPFPDRDLVPIKEYTRKVNGVNATSIIASRGCPYSCSYCINSTKYLFSKVRFRSIDNIIREMKEIIFKYQFKSFVFYDDTFTIRPDLYELLKEIKKLNITFRCNGNARKDTYELFLKLYDAGCVEIDFGIESGSQKILDIIGKKVTVAQNRLAIYQAKKAGLMVKSFLMVGSPGENWDTIKETVKFMNDTRPQYWTLFNFVPLPGCDIYNNPDKYNIKIVNKDYNKYFNIAGQNESGTVVETEYMTADEIKKAREYMLENLHEQTGPLQDYYKKLNK